jgi:hypothetical protein
VATVPTGASTGNVIVTVGGVASNPEVFVVPTSNFKLSGSALNTARALHTATLLENGTVLFAGGASTVPALASELLADAEVYDPVADTFTPTTSLNTARSNHTATLLNNGQVLIACGNGTGSLWRGLISPLTSSELYDAIAGTFTPTGSTNAARFGHTATLLNNGTVLIAGGTGFSHIPPGREPLNSAELYNPATGIFTATGNMNAVHWLHTATLLNNGQVLIAGGQDGNANTTAELYNLSTGTFTLTGSLNVGRTSALGHASE